RYLWWICRRTGGGDQRGGRVSSTVAAQLRTESIDAVRRSVVYAAPGPAIVEIAEATRPNLIVMATGRSRRGGRPAPAGVGQFVRERTRLPIVLVTVAETVGEDRPDRLITDEMEI